MSRKTKIAVPPDTELDWDDENHRRHIEDEAFSGAPWIETGRPRRRPPERSRLWWFWRFYGVFVRVPLRRAFRAWLASDWKRPDDPFGPGYEVYRWPGAESFKAWLDRGASAGPRATWARKILGPIVEQRGWHCPTCGFEEFHEEHEVRKYGDLVRTVDLFEPVFGGGVDYFGEAEDCHGWLWCWRCGQVSWETV